MIVRLRRRATLGPMELAFAATEDGRPLYRVVRQGQVVFTGAREECARFLALRRAKERRELLRRPRDPEPRDRRR